MDEVKRWYIWNEQGGCYYFSMKTFKGWWYLRILRWVRMTTLRDFLMRWFYEPFYSVIFSTDLGGYDTSSEEDIRKLISAEEAKRYHIPSASEEVVRKLPTAEEVKRVKPE